MTATWTAPVATATPPRFFAYALGGNKLWCEIDPDATPDPTDDRVVVQVDPVKNGFRLSCVCFYSSEGRCELTITYPLGQALAVFAGLLETESAVEAGEIAPVIVAG